MKPLTREEAEKLIANIFPALSINHLADYTYSFKIPDNPMLPRNNGRIILKSDETEITLDIFDNSPCDWSIFKLKVKVHGMLILMQTGQYNNISFVVSKETDYCDEEKLKELFFYEYELIFS